MISNRKIFEATLRPLNVAAKPENWFAMLEKYSLTPSCYDAFLESRLFANRTMSLTEQVNMMKRDLRCAKLLGFPVIRTLVPDGRTAILR